MKDWKLKDHTAPMGIQERTIKWKDEKLFNVIKMLSTETKYNILALWRISQIRAFCVRR